MDKVDSKILKINISKVAHALLGFLGLRITGKAWSCTVVKFYHLRRTRPTNQDWENVVTWQSQQIMSDWMSSLDLGPPRLSGLRGYHHVTTSTNQDWGNIETTSPGQPIRIEEVSSHVQRSQSRLRRIVVRPIFWSGLWTWLRTTAQSLSFLRVML